MVCSDAEARFGVDVVACEAGYFAGDLGFCRWHGELLQCIVRDPYFKPSTEEHSGNALGSLCSLDSPGLESVYC